MSGSEKPSGQADVSVLSGQARESCMYLGIGGLIILIIVLIILFR